MQKLTLEQNMGPKPVSLPYSPENAHRIKKLGGKWLPQEKKWLLPLPSLRGVYPLLSDEEKRWAEGALEEWKRSAKNDPVLTKLRPEQVEDLRYVLNAFLRRGRLPEAPKGFLLANGTGTGKTYIFGAFLKLISGLGLESMVVVPNADIARQTRGVFSYLGTEGVTITTYAQFDPQDAKDKVLVLDEAHLAKNASSRGKRAWKAVQSSYFTLYVTATPFDKLWESAYLLVPSGFLDEEGTDFRGFMERYGVFYYELDKQGGYRFFGNIEHLQSFHNRLKERGFLRKRILIPDVQVSYETPLLSIDREGRDLFHFVRRRLKDWGKRFEGQDYALYQAQLTVFSRGILERLKLKSAIPFLKRYLAEGWHVILFVQYRADKGEDWVKSTLESEETSWVTKEIAKALEGTKIDLPSPIDLVVSELNSFTSGRIGVYAGGISERKLAETKALWDEGALKLLVVTAQKGGVGLSLHDTRGNRPTLQMVLTLPWTATQLDQILGRVVRVGVASPVRIVLPVSGLPFERKLGKVVAEAVATLGHAVRGGEEKLDEVVQAFLLDYAAVDPIGFQKMLDSNEFQ